MKSTLIDNKEEKEIKYPCLMTATNDDAEKIVVLFTNKKFGTVVYSERKIHPIGFYTETWVMSKFTPFDGTVELSNN